MRSFHNVTLIFSTSCPVALFEFKPFANLFVALALFDVANIHRWPSFLGSAIRTQYQHLETNKPHASYLSTYLPTIHPPIRPSFKKTFSFMDTANKSVVVILFLLFFSTIVALKRCKTTKTKNVTGGGDDGGKRSNKLPYGRQRVKGENVSKMNTRTRTINSRSLGLQ